MILDVKNITLMDETETKEAEELYKKCNKIFCWMFIAPLIIFIIVGIGTICQFNDNTFVSGGHGSTGYTINNNPSLLNGLYICCIIFALLTIIGFFVYRKLMRPYKKLLKLAEKNDLIRHEEKIRYKERARLQKEHDKKYVTKDIENTIKKLDIK